MTQSVILLPESILQSVLLKQLSEDQAVLVHLTFDALDPEKEYEKINGTYHQWADAVDWKTAGGEPQFNVSVNETRLEIGFAGVPHPVVPIQSLLQAYTQSGLPLKKAFVSVVELDEEGAPSPHGEDFQETPEFESLEDEDDFWKRSFDLTTPPPDTEDPDGMFAVAQMDGGGMITEFRPFTLYFPDVRVVYGLGNIEDEPPNERCHTLLASLRKALAAYFTPNEQEAIQLFNQEGEANQRLDRIRHEQRMGYSFAVRREDLSAFVGEHFRYMEYELLLSLRDVVRQENLQPTLHWSRDEVYIFNLWERLSS